MSSPESKLPASSLWLSFAAFVVYGLPGGALGVAWLEMQSGFGRTLEALGQLLAVLMLGNLLTSASSGPLVRRFGLGQVCLAGSLLMTAGLAGYALAPGWSALLAATLVLGLGMGLLNAGINTFAAAHFRSSRMNWLHAFYGLGSALGPFLVTLLVIRGGQPWQLVFGLFALAQLGISLMLASTLSGWHLEQLPDPSSARLRATDSLQHLVVWLAIALFFVHNGLALSAGQLSGTLFVEGRGHSPDIAGSWVSVYFFAVLLGRILLGFVSDQLGPRDLLRAGTAATVLGAALLWWSPLPLAGFLGLALMGLSLAPIYPTGISRAPALVGRQHAANAIGFMIAGGAIGSAFTPWLIGLLSRPLGLGAVAAAFFVLALLQFLVHERLLSRERTLPSLASKP